MCAAKNGSALLKPTTLRSPASWAANASTENVAITQLLDLEANLSERTLEEFAVFIQKYYELKNIFYICPSLPGRTITDPYILGTYSQEWIEHYRERNYVNLDPVINVGARSLLPIDWAKLPRSSPKIQKFFGEATDFGVGRQGLTIPVRGPTNGLWALFCMTTDDTQAEWQARHYELIRDMVHVAHFIQQRAFEMHHQDEGIDINTITKREIEALSWSAEGKTLEDISVLMRISQETVKAHLDSARYKLGALNRIHAVAKAIRAGLIR
ncbi:helix-turn-helix transcriptional regulator [Beijerinckia indica]|uniref:Transcriptional regulator, LuxR family n=1 Tax=Beijerinckia indica subsp. indica (strain ATCC 9039 / DSM 1715 / NCIMB 8712) TaxID=395963 RepID=B2IHP8_BEII9|nr:LuxR family transcriptional regulator [Beijerinckia indica]ACB94569.1 transcriptional regulator, LuxR family [Beijerinckia indica subsp. indica ATCC 9039]